MDQGGRLIFHIYLYRNFKNLLVRNHWTNFNISEIFDHHVSLDHKIYTKILNGLVCRSSCSGERYRTIMVLLLICSIFFLVSSYLAK